MVYYLAKYKDLRLKKFFFIFIFMFYFFSKPAVAASSLKDSCPENGYIPDTIIDSINVLPTTYGVGPKLNIRVNGKWYGQYIKNNEGSDNSILADLVIRAYESAFNVNVCINMGEITGVELLGFTEQKAKK